MRNAEATLERCLESVVCLCDEIVVVDTGSSDDSRSIARSFGARVLEVQWTDDFAAARNAYLADARCSWILSLDADEYLDPINRSDLYARLAEIRAVAFIFSVRNYFYTDEFPEPWFPSRVTGEVLPGISCMISRTVRLFPRAPRVRYCYPVHESIIPSLRKQKIPVRKCAIPIHHTGYLSGIEQRRTKALLYRELGLKKIAQYPEYALAYLELGRVYLHDGRLEDAERMFRDSIRLRSDYWDAHLFLALALLRQGRYNECRTNLQSLMWNSHCRADALHFISALNQLT
jgi:glycosyltransferase involved in cell wall biosynthesis